METDMNETIAPETVKLPQLVASATGKPMAIIPRSVEEVWRIVTMVEKAGLAPAGMKNKEAMCVAIMHGAEIGLTPMQALQRIAVINGRPTVWGEAVLGLALATNLVEDYVERIDGEGDHMVATCTVKRKGVRTPTTRTFSVADAKTAKLWGKAGPWTQYPKRMLQMRARVAFRDLFADALGGLYIAEEVIGIEDHAKDVTPTVIQPVPPPPADGSKKELPPLAHQPTVKETQTFVSTKVIEGELVHEPVPEAKPKKNGHGKAKKELPPLAAAAKEKTVVEPVAEVGNVPPKPLSEEEAQRYCDTMLDQLEFCESEMTLSAWAQNNIATVHRMPKDMKAKVETAFNLKQATLQKQGRQGP